MCYVLSRSAPILLLTCLAAPGHANDLNTYRIQDNLFNDYKPAHQRANPGAPQERARQQERNRIERESDQKRGRPYSGTIDNRDYSRSRPDNNTRYHSHDSNRHRNSGTISNLPHETAPGRAGANPKTGRWIGLDAAARNPNTSSRPPNPETANNTGKSPPQPGLNPHTGNSASRQHEKYYGTRSGESLYPYTTKPVKGTTAADQTKNKNVAARPTYNAPASHVPPRDPSYGGNRAWNLSRQNQADTRRFYQDEITKYRREHRQPDYCKDGTVSGKGTGACSGHGGLFKRN